jgi:hypothetical protein
MLLLILACSDPKSTEGPGLSEDSPALADSGADGGADSGDSGEPGPDLSALAGQVSADRLLADIQTLEGFGSRHVEAEGHDLSRDWLVSELEGMGLEVELHSFTQSGVSGENVIARLPGEADGGIWIYSAHYDSTSNEPTTAAPGADDNASAVAAVLEAGRILGPLGRRDAIWLVLTDAEESGSLGSLTLAEELAAAGEPVRGVIAPDMIGYWPLGEGDAFDILGDRSSEWMVDGMSEVADRLGVAHKTWIEHGYCYGDDHTRFQEEGIPAISPMDCVEAHNVPSSGEHTPHYHKTSDTSETLHLPFTAKVAGVVLVSLAEWAGVEG